MHWFQGPQHWLDHHKLARDLRAEPFTPRVPAFVLSHPALFGGLVAAFGVFANWMIARNATTMPDWMLLPAMLVSVLGLIGMVIGLGLLTVRMLEPVLSIMDFKWDAEPLALMGIPLPLQRRCESLGFWTAEDLVQAIDRGKFPWTQLEYDERMQLQRAAERWNASIAAEQRSRGRLGVLGRKRVSRRHLPGNESGR